jgi:hypothetical protein
MSTSTKEMKDLIKFDDVRTIKAIALYAWMLDINQPNKRYAPFSATQNSIAYDEPDTTFYSDTGMAPSIKKATDAKQDPDKLINMPNMAELLEMMIFIRALLNGDAVIKDPPAFANVTSDFKEFRQRPNKETLDSLADTGNQAETVEKRRKLGLQMLSTLTAYRETSFKTVEEQISSDPKSISDIDRERYETFSALHARALYRHGGGSELKDEGQSAGSRALGVAGRGLVILPLYPLFIVVGAALFLGSKVFGTNVNALLGRLPFGIGDAYKKSEKDYTSVWHSLFSGLDYKPGEAGSKYWAQARLNMPGNIKQPWGFTSWALFGNGVYNVVHNSLGAASIGIVSLAEFIVKMSLWPLKAVVGYDRLASDSITRQAINGLENTIVGVLSSPVILFNHFYRAVMDWSAKTFTTFANDPDIEWLSRKSKGGIYDFDHKTVSLFGPQPFIAAGLVLFKIFRFVFDTIASIGANTLVPTSRSILPAMPFTTREQRNKVFDGLWYTVYMGLFVITGLFTVSVFLSSLGVALPAGLLSIFGAAPGASTPAEIAAAYGNQIGNVITTIGNGFVSFISNPVQFFVNNLNPVNAFQSVFGKEGYVAQLFSIDFNLDLSKASKVLISISSVVGTVIAGATVSGLRTKYKENSEKKADLEKLPTRIDTETKVIKKITENTKVLGKEADNTSTLMLWNQQAKLKASLVDKQNATKAPAPSGASASTNSTPASKSAGSTNTNGRKN